MAFFDCQSCASDLVLEPRLSVWAPLGLRYLTRQRVPFAV